MADNQNPVVDGRLGAEMDDDLPLPPPDHVAATIPPFYLYGERECGDHRHDTSNSTSNSNSNSNSNSDNHEAVAWQRACTNCHARATLNQLHDLPCGDLICRECLLVKVLSVKLHIEANHRKIREARTKMRAIDLCFARRPGPGGAMTPARKRMLCLRHSRLRASVLCLAGLACCGRDMGLHRFLPCLGPDRARELWLALKWVTSMPSEQRACGWPDCGAYVPSCCSYYSALPGGDRARRWHCVTCQGNSMECARNLTTAQTRFPFLPRGQPALTPAR
ncbi:uncharacterized protein P884DRAFT_321074 [Thermothelomyces heterothallicus CBS 202.75]|uniref:uncharacterized protein n=1 Tax=Thermothelomyces heterothallicus CBS 202.75 TaxID=1149848 RepID=UPI0037436499